VWVQVQPPVQLSVVCESRSLQSASLAHSAPHLALSQVCVSVLVPVVHLSYVSSQAEVNPGAESQVNGLLSGLLLQVAIEGKLFGLQSLLVPPQAPDAHLSEVVQKRPSSQVVPSALFLVLPESDHLVDVTE
jgi:hypothetical protein